jgi:hypothetical protein
VQLLLIQKVAIYSTAAGILDDLWLQVAAYMQAIRIVSTKYPEKLYKVLQFLNAGVESCLVKCSGLYRT